MAPFNFEKYIYDSIKVDGDPEYPDFDDCQKETVIEKSTLKHKAKKSDKETKWVKRDPNAKAGRLIPQNKTTSMIDAQDVDNLDPADDYSLDDDLPDDPFAVLDSMDFTNIRPVGDDEEIAEDVDVDHHDSPTGDLPDDAPSFFDALDDAGITSARPAGDDPLAIFDVLDDAGITSARPAGDDPFAVFDVLDDAGITNARPAGDDAEIAEDASPFDALYAVGLTSTRPASDEDFGDYDPENFDFECLVDASDSKDKQPGVYGVSDKELLQSFKQIIDDADIPISQGPKKPMDGDYRPIRRPRQA